MGDEAFRAERQQLLDGVITSPLTELRCCYARSWGPENSLFEVARARPADSLPKISLYPPAAMASTRPIWEFHSDPLTDIDGVPQGSICSVIGELSPGHAVMVRVAQGYVGFVSLTGLRMPLRGKRFGKVSRISP